MPTGVDTPEDKRAEFRAEYLLSGNASEAARKVGIPESTGRDIAQVLTKQPDFVADRRALHANYLSECVAARMVVMRKARERAVADEADVYPGEHGPTVVDKRTDWANVVLNAEKNAHHLAKIEQEDGDGDEKPAVINLIVSGPDGQSA